MGLCLGPFGREVLGVGQFLGISALADRAALGRVHRALPSPPRPQDSDQGLSLYPIPHDFYGECIQAHSEGGTGVAPCPVLNTRIAAFGRVDRALPSPPRPQDRHPGLLLWVVEIGLTLPVSQISDIGH